jgi:hypothetical protein
LLESCQLIYKARFLWFFSLAFVLLDLFLFPASDISQENDAQRAELQERNKAMIQALHCTPPQIGHSSWANMIRTLRRIAVQLRAAPAVGNSAVLQTKVIAAEQLGFLVSGEGGTTKVHLDGLQLGRIMQRGMTRQDIALRLGINLKLPSTCHKHPISLKAMRHFG